MLILQRRARDTRGFTLTEAAIVLGIMGLILGAIWVAAASVFNNMKLKRANEELLQVAQAVRSLYASSNTTGAAVNTDLTSAMRTAGVFPSDMVAGTVINNPWNIGSTTNTVWIYAAESAAGAQNRFKVTLTGLSSSSCIGLLTANTGQARDTGLAAAGSNTASTSTFPISVTTASTTYCAAAGSTNSAEFTFNLKP